MNVEIPLAQVEKALNDFESTLPAEYWEDGEGMDDEEFQILSEAHSAFRDLIDSLRVI